MFILHRKKQQGVGNSPLITCHSTRKEEISMELIVTLVFFGHVHSVVILSLKFVSDLDTPLLPSPVVPPE